MGNPNTQNLARLPPPTGFETMNTPLKIVMALLSVILLAGCAAFEGFPSDVHQHLSHSLDGRLYDPGTAKDREATWWSDASAR